jgi:uncharacterized protein
MLILLAIVLVIVGLAGIVVPGLPGPILIFAGLVLAAWSDGLTRVGVGTLVIIAIVPRPRI